MGILRPDTRQLPVSFVRDTLAQFATILDALPVRGDITRRQSRHQPPASAPGRRFRQILATMPPSGRPSVFTSPRCRDPASRHEATLFIVQDQVSHIRETACVADATRLPADVAEQHRGVRLAVIVHEHQLLAQLGLEYPR